MAKKQIVDEELENVSGGAVLDGQIAAYCPKCNKTLHNNHRQARGSGCDTYYHYTCPHCGYEWDD